MFCRTTPVRCHAAQFLGTAAAKARTVSPLLCSHSPVSNESMKEPHQQQQQRMLNRMFGAIDPRTRYPPKRYDSGGLNNEVEGQLQSSSSSVSSPFPWYHPEKQQTDALLQRLQFRVAALAPPPPPPSSENGEEVTRMSPSSRSREGDVAVSDEQVKKQRAVFIHGRTMWLARRAHAHRRVPTTELAEGSPVHWGRFSTFEPRATDVIFESVTKTRRFVDKEVAFCYLCREPVNSLLGHCGWWEHTNGFTMLRTIAAHRRIHKPQLLIADTQNTVFLSQRALRRRATGALVSAGVASTVREAAAAVKQERWVPSFPASLATFSSRVLHGFEDESATRLATLRALLSTLVARDAIGYCFDTAALDSSILPSHPLASSTQGVQKMQPLLRTGSENQGERSFRETVSRISNTMMPPLSPQAMSRFQQKCWGRKNLALFFDMLQITTFQEERTAAQQQRRQCLGMSTPLSRREQKLRQQPQDYSQQSKDQKGAVMRLLFFELHCLTDLAVQSGAVRPRRASDSNQFLPESEVPMSVYLAELALDKFAFELIYVRSALIVEEAEPVWNAMGLPTCEEMERSGYF